MKIQNNKSYSFNHFYCQLKMTSLPPAYPTLEQEPNQEATNPPPPTHAPAKLDIEVGGRSVPRNAPIRRTNNTNSDDTKRSVLRIVYVLVFVYAVISIFFSFIFGIIGFGFAYYAWYEFKSYGNPTNSIIGASVSFIFSSLSYLVPVVIFILLSQNVISVNDLII